MKIGMVGGWNTDSGASLHAELIGRAWVELGHQLYVFTFYDYAIHGTQIVGKDEPFVERCFTVSGYKPNELNPIPFLAKDYEIFVVQDLGMLPKDLLAKIFHRIKKRTKTVNVIHDGKLAEDPAFYQFEWDAIVCFDKRYENFLKTAYKDEKIYIIPYPCIPPNLGNKIEKRKKLGLPQDKKIIFSFGPSSKTTTELIPAIKELNYPILLLIVTKSKESLSIFSEIKKQEKIEIEIREESPYIDRLYDYLHASDVLVFNKTAPNQVVVSSTAFQCLGSGCPIIAKDTGYVEYFDKEIFKYSDNETFKKHLISVFEEDDKYKEVKVHAIEYAKKNSNIEIGKKFIELFKKL